MPRYYVGRAHAPSGLCEGCQMRLTIGYPTVSTEDGTGPPWSQRLDLDERRIKDLTEAAAEFDQITEDAGMGRFTALEFIDWLTPSTQFRMEAPQFDGMPSRNLDGSKPDPTNNKRAPVRDPFPVPLQGNGERHTKGRRQLA